jgi:hypothetical protein
MEAALQRMEDLCESIKPGVASADVVRRLIEFAVLKAVDTAQRGKKKSAAYLLRNLDKQSPIDWLLSQKEDRRTAIYDWLGAALNNGEVRKSVAAFLIPTGSGDLTAEECVAKMVKLIQEALPDDIDQLGPNVLNSEEFAARVSTECELDKFVYLPRMDEQVMTLFLLLVPTGHLDVISQFNFAPTTNGNKPDDEKKGCDAVALYVENTLTTGTTHGTLIHHICAYKYKGLKRDKPVLNDNGLSIQLANKGRSNGSVEFVATILYGLSTHEGAKYNRFHIAAAYAMLVSIATDKNVDCYPELKACIKNACNMAFNMNHQPELLPALQLVMPTSEAMLSAADNEESMTALWPLLYGVYNKKATKADPQGFFSSKERMLRVSPTATGGKKRKRKEQDDEEKEEDDEEEDDESDFTDDEEE